MQPDRRLFLLTAAASLLAACGKKRSRQTGAVLAAGDSLTAGYGAAPGSDWPAVFAALTGRRTVNAGISGDTSAGLAARLPALLEQRFDAVIIGIGGNDFMRRVPEADTRAHISRIIEAVKSRNMQPVLAAEPHFTLGALVGRFSDHPLYEDLARQHRIPLLAGAWSDILSDPSLKSDQIHANEAGYKIFAEKAAAFLADKNL